jgi:hypothetical protein
VFELNPEVTWQEVGLETKLRLKTLLTEAVSGTENQCFAMQSEVRSGDVLRVKLFQLYSE